MVNQVNWVEVTRGGYTFHVRSVKILKYVYSFQEARVHDYSFRLCVYLLVLIYVTLKPPVTRLSNLRPSAVPGWRRE